MLFVVYISCSTLAQMGFITGLHDTICTCEASISFWPSFNSHLEFVLRCMFTTEPVLSARPDPSQAWRGSDLRRTDYSVGKLKLLSTEAADRIPRFAAKSPNALRIP